MPPTAKGMRDGNQLERMYAAGFKVPSGDLLEDERDENEKRYQDGLKAARCCFMQHSRGRIQD